MNESKHTPGPWVATKADIYDSDPNRWSVCTSGERGYFIATIENDAPGDTLKTEEANARLIAAAPDLFKAATGIIWLANNAHNVQQDPEGFVTFLKAAAEDAREAVAKATGQEAQP